MTVDGHHAYAGGAIQHTVAVATLCRETCQLHPRLDESVVAAAALTFCVGAADAFLPGAALQLGEEGRLLGVPLLSLRRVEREAHRLRTPRERLLPARALHRRRPAEDARRPPRSRTPSRSTRASSRRWPAFGTNRLRACSDSRCSSST